MSKRIADRLGVIPVASFLTLALLTAGLFLVKSGFFGLPVAADLAGEEAAALAQSAESPMAAFLRAREQLRACHRAELNEMIHAEDADPTLRAAARRSLLELEAREEAEQTVEGVLRLRGFAEVVCTVHGDSVNVLLRADALNRETCALIYDLVGRETGIGGDNVKIIPMP